MKKKKRKSRKFKFGESISLHVFRKLALQTKYKSLYKRNKLSEVLLRNQTTMIDKHKLTVSLTNKRYQNI